MSASLRNCNRAARSLIQHDTHWRHRPQFDDTRYHDETNKFKEPWSVFIAFSNDLPAVCCLHLLAGLYPGLDLRDQWLRQQLKSAGMYSAALSAHYEGARAEQGLLLGFSGVPEEGMRTGVDCLKQFLRLNAR